MRDYGLKENKMVKESQSIIQDAEWKVLGKMEF